MCFNDADKANESNISIEIKFDYLTITMVRFKSIFIDMTAYNLDAYVILPDLER